MAKTLDALPYYKWLWRDWRANRRVQRMHFVARGLYRELLDEQWSEGSIPNELSELADICGCPIEVMEEHWEEIRTYFHERPDGRLVNGKMETQRTDQDSSRIKQADSGRRGAFAKLNKINEGLASAEGSLASAEQPPYSRAEQEQSISSSRAEHSPEIIFDKEEETDMNAITEVKKICNQTLGLDPHIWDSDKKRVREHVVVQGATVFTRRFQEWCDDNAGTTSKNPLSDFLKVAPGIFAGTFSPAAAREVIDLTRELTFLSNRVVVFDDRTKAGVSGLLRNGNNWDEVVAYFKEFFQNLDTNNPKAVEFAAKKFVETADAGIYARRRERVRKEAEQAAGDRAREIMEAEGLADREARRRAKEAEEALIEETLE